MKRFVVGLVVGVLLAVPIAFLVMQTSQVEAAPWANTAIRHVLRSKTGGWLINGEEHLWQADATLQPVAQTPAVACIGGSGSESGLWRLSDRQLFRAASAGASQLSFRLPAAVQSCDAIASNTDVVFVGDGVSDCVWILSRADGAVQAQIKNIVTPPGRVPMDCDADGRLYVANSGRYTVQVFDSQGQELAQFGGKTRDLSGFGGCCNPVGLAVVGNGRFVTVEQNPIRIRLWDLQRGQIGEVPWADDSSIQADCRRDCTGIAGLTPVIGQDGLSVVDHATGIIVALGPLAPIQP